MEAPLMNNIAYDYALIKLTEKVVKSENFICLNPNNLDKNQQLAIYGYPDEKFKAVKNTESTSQWGLNKKLAVYQIREEKKQIVHSISTVPGQSGAPIIAVRGNELSVAGIHKGGLKIKVKEN